MKKRYKYFPNPTFLISPMRCGSNFLANVVCKSSGNQYSSIYDPETTPIYENNPNLIIKSHAPSYLHLLSECGAFIPFMNRLPHKMIVLVRDPRDMFISMYDWMEARLKEEISQESFLDDMKYCYSAPGLGQLSPEDAYKEFIKNWWQVNKHSSVKSVFRIKFEDLVSDKKTMFEEIKTFLNLDFSIEEELFGEKVQQLSEKRSERGSLNSHVLYKKEYEVLIDKVECAMAEEIDILGYEE